MSQPAKSVNVAWSERCGASSAVRRGGVLLIGVLPGRWVPPCERMPSMGEGEVVPPHLSSEPERFAMTRRVVTCTLGGAGTFATFSAKTAARFSDVPRPRGNGACEIQGRDLLLRRPGRRTGPELSRADSSGRYAVGADIIARICVPGQGH